MSAQTTGTTVHDAVYLDTSVIVAAAVVGAQVTNSCRRYCHALVGRRARIYFSATTRIEIAQTIRKLATRQDRLDDITRARFGLARWGIDEHVRHGWMQHGLEEVNRLLGTFTVVSELPFDDRVWPDCIELMIRQSLQSHDAVHAATARAYGIMAFATLDADFLRVPDLNAVLLRD